MKLWRRVSNWIPSGIVLGYHRVCLYWKLYWIISVVLEGLHRGYGGSCASNQLAACSVHSAYEGPLPATQNPQHLQREACARRAALSAQPAMRSAACASFKLLLAQVRPGAQIYGAMHVCLCVCIFDCNAVCVCAGVWLCMWVGFFVSGCWQCWVWIEMNLLCVF